MVGIRRPVSLLNGTTAASSLNIVIQSYIPSLETKTCLVRVVGHDTEVLAMFQPCVSAVQSA